jgi:hypothetical protein
MNRQAKKKSIWQGLILVMTSLFAGFTPAAGLLTPSDGSLPVLETREHHVDVLIEDGYAITTVEQVFVNPHDRDLESRYLFPVPAHGSVVELTVWIDGQPITGEVLEREKARQLYIVGLLQQWRELRHPLILLTGVGAAVKILVEIDTGQALLTDSAWPSVPVVHAAGFVCGLLSGCGIWISDIIGRRHHGGSLVPYRVGKTIFCIQVIDHSTY